ncbi:MAG TPA: hypothetical protein VHY22_15915 [Chthoniobacteraceae bacterium]|nr:hypothetical protein [Chthoniobacteraceae bacterium]
MAPRQWLLPAGVVLGYALLMASNPVRHSLMDGLRALRRYTRIWVILAALGLCYSLFHLGLTAYFQGALPLEFRPAFGWRFDWSIPPWNPELRETRNLHDWLGVVLADPRGQAIYQGALDGLESLAGLFNIVVTTFPICALAAIMLLCNWENHHRTLHKALRRRFGRWGYAVHAGILLCAVSAILAPVLFGPGLQYLNRAAPGLSLVRWASLIDWFSSLFADLFGTGVQIYLILIVYTWIRGLNWTSIHLMDLSIRRFSFVVKWAAVVMAFRSILIDLPRLSALLFRFGDSLYFERTLAYMDYVARPLLALILIFFSSMQITLTFHSETLQKAKAHHWQFLRNFWWPFSWFVLIAAIHLFALGFLNRWLLLGFGGNTTAAGMLWSLVYPLVSAFLAAWLLAAWVALFRRCETGREEVPF